MSNIDQLKIAFDRNGDNWVLIPEKDLVQKKYRKQFYPEILARKNFIIEPANPYNDLAVNLKPPTVRKLKHFAEKMLERLDDLEKEESSIMKTWKADGTEIHYDKLFEPFPIRLRSQYSHGAIPVYLLIHYDYQNYETAHCRTDENNREFFRGKPEAKRVVKAIRNNLLFLIRLNARREKSSLKFTDGLAEMNSKEDVKKAMQVLIDQNFGVKKFIKESNVNKEHQAYDATVFVPYRLGNRTLAVKLSMKWEH